MARSKRKRNGFSTHGIQQREKKRNETVLNNDCLFFSCSQKFRAKQREMICGIREIGAFTRIFHLFQSHCAFFPQFASYLWYYSSFLSFLYNIISHFGYNSHNGRMKKTNRTKYHLLISFVSTHAIFHYYLHSHFANIYLTISSFDYYYYSLKTIVYERANERTKLHFFRHTFVFVVVVFSHFPFHYMRAFTLKSIMKPNTTKKKKKKLLDIILLQSSEQHIFTLEKKWATISHQHDIYTNTHLMKIHSMLLK